MRWAKIGRIFDPTDHDIPVGGQFAQAPQALVMDDRLRVFFSTRTMDPSGKALSHIAFADFDEEFRVIGTSRSPVIQLGKLGCYDEHGIFPLNVVRHAGTVRGYIGGWSRRVSVPVDGAIGLAVSLDGGTTFTRVGDGPVLAATEGEPFMIADPFVSVVGGLHHMWYIFGTAWKRYHGSGSPERIYKIGHATSTDGVRWGRPEPGRQIVADRLGRDECQALPTVITLKGRHHMLFCYRPSIDFRRNPGRGYQMGYAVSEDAVTWRRADEFAGIAGTSDDWDSDMLCYPHMFKWREDVFLLYNGNAFGRWGFGAARLTDI